MHVYWPGALGVFALSVMLYGQPVLARTGERIYHPANFTTRVDADSADSVIQVVPPTGARDHEWRIYLESPEAHARARVEIRDAASNRLFTVESLSENTLGSWTETLPARVVLLTTDGTATITVGAIGVRSHYTEPETPVGPNNIELFEASGPSFQLTRVARGIGRLSLAAEPVVGADTTSTTDTIFCTVFLVRPKVVVTTAHCVAGSLENRHSEIWFEYLAGIAVERSKRFTARVVEVSQSLDAALLELDRALPDEFVLDLAQNPVQSDKVELVLLQHYAGAHLAVSDDSDCEIREYGIPGPPIWDTGRNFDATIKDAAFGHGCDTSKSSSGAPVLDVSGHRVLGMHRRGYQDGERQFNHAIRSDYLANWIEKTTD